MQRLDSFTQIRFGPITIIKLHLLLVAWRIPGRLAGCMAALRGGRRAALRAGRRAGMRAGRHPGYGPGKGRSFAIAFKSPGAILTTVILLYKIGGNIVI